jgi:hypothetical protein
MPEISWMYPLSPSATACAAAAAEKHEGVEGADIVLGAVVHEHGGLIHGEDDAGLLGLRGAWDEVLVERLSSRYNEDEIPPLALMTLSALRKRFLESTTRLPSSLLASAELNP